ncbi:hypothetical protein [Microlunatus sp. Gsoil 973]|uniref:hypothetical protein n=1 Tax=Microlunatus sp. Gsoil 973 TaxID=2672569 RepID=UPI001E61DB98|nr:hypothetical protein [Microlunatus sp. Gsoil 973]
MAGWSRGLATGVSGLHCLIALGCGILVQPLGRRLGAGGAPVPMAAGLGAGALGLLVGGFAVVSGAPAGFLLAAAVLGCGYGLLMVSGLSEVQRLAGPGELARLTAIYYCLAYLGFLVPAGLAALSRWFSYPLMFAGGSALALATLVVVVIGGRLTRREPATAIRAGLAERVGLIPEAAD